jgi:hypothetical protein
MKQAYKGWGKIETVPSASFHILSSSVFVQLPFRSTLRNAKSIETLG